MNAFGQCMSRSAVCLAAAAVAGCGSGVNNADIVTVALLGTNVTSSIKTDGKFAVITVPLDSAGHAVVGDGLKVVVNLSSLTDDVLETTCTVPTAAEPLSVGVIIDDTGSMSTNDPANQTMGSRLVTGREKAVNLFADTVGAKDRVLLTEYGRKVGQTPLTDLVCLKANPGSPCVPTPDGFTSDAAKLKEAATLIANPGGSTPLYEACAQMVSVMKDLKGVRPAILILSDGGPNTSATATTCISAATSAQIPVYAVGLGNAAEGSPTQSTTAVKALRDITAETNGAYASSLDNSALTGMFQIMGTALSQGSCRSTVKINEFSTLTVGRTVTGEVVVGSKGAKAALSFVVP